MSLAAELLIARIAENAGGPGLSFLSWTGLGCPLLDCGASPPYRLAVRPLGGVTPGGVDGLATWAPPADLSRDTKIATRLATSGLMIVDALGVDGRDALWRALSPVVGAIRLRGAPEASAGGAAKRGFELVFADDAVAPAIRDHVLVRQDLLSDGVRRLAADLAARKVDEFDRLRAIIRDGDVFTDIRFGAGYSRCRLHPVRALDQPDAYQLDAALGDGRLVLDRDGVASLATPQFAASPAPFGLVINDVSPDGPPPVVHFDEAGAWNAATSRVRNGWRITATPASARPAEATVFEIRLPGGQGATISDVWVGVRRRRAAWEAWDEADALLKLEESW